MGRRSRAGKAADPAASRQRVALFYKCQQQSTLISDIATLTICIAMQHANRSAA
jgi:hypothetical protein